jgi:hypothetical protein
MRRTIAAVVVALGTALSLAPAASPAAGMPPAAYAAPSPGALARGHAERALDLAQDLLTEPAAAPTDPAPVGALDGTPAMSDLHESLPALDAADRRAARALLARPTAGDGDPYGDGYTVSAKRRCDGHFCVHWVPTTSDAPSGAAWITRTLSVMNAVWAEEVGTLGYRRPLADAGRGGDTRFDVYLKELGSRGYYGYCAPEKAKAGTPRDLRTGYCVLDNDFARAQYGARPLDSLRVTAAHEFFHAVQFAYDASEDAWFMEATATWMEERYADAINDNRQYLPFGQVARPATVLDVFNGSGFNQYGNWPFFEYLSSRYGNRVVRTMWERAGSFDGAPHLYSTAAVASVLGSRGGLRDVFAGYAAGNTVPERTYAEGSHWPRAAIARQWTLTRSDRNAGHTLVVDHLSSRNVVASPGGSLDGPRWLLRLHVDGPGHRSDPAAYLIVEHRGGRLTRRAVTLDATGSGTTTVGFSAARIRDVTLTVANVSTRFDCGRHTVYSCGGDPRDDNERFAVTLRAYQG